MIPTPERATAALAELFFETACAATSFPDLESDAIDLGHGCVAEAFGLALEALDAQLLAERPESLRVHDIRPRSLATEIGDASFSIRRYRDRFGRDVYLLADALDIAYGARVSPGATEFLVETAAHVSYAKATKLLARHGSPVRPQTVMGCMRKAERLCAEEDGQRLRFAATGSCPRRSVSKRSFVWKPMGRSFACRANPAMRPNG